MRTFAILLTAAKGSGKRVFAVIQFAIGKDNGECNKRRLQLAASLFRLIGERGIVNHLGKMALCRLCDGNLKALL